MAETTITENYDNGQITFILNDIDLSGVLNIDATVPDETTDVSFAGDVILNGDISLSVVNELFKFQTDYQSVDDISNTDLKYKHVINETNRNEFVTSVIESTKPIFNIQRNAGEEYIGYIALNVFGTRHGVDIIDNEEEVTNAVITDMSNAFHTYLVDISSVTYDEDDISNNVVTEPIARNLLKTIMRLDGRRLDSSGNTYDAVNYPNEPRVRMTDISGFQGVPIAVGDVLVVRYEIHDSQEHCADLSGNSFIPMSSPLDKPRSYLIKLTVV